MKNRAIIFGDSGFIGRPLIEKLKEDHEVIGISRHSLKNSHNHINLDLSNIECKSYLKKLITDFNPNFIFHYAANPLVKDYTVEVSQNNIISTHILLDSLTPECRLVFASSATVYGDHSIVRTVLDKTNPSSVYGMAKVYCEDLIKYYFSIKKLRSYCIIRYTAHLGKSASHGLIFDILNKLKSGSEYLELFGNSPGAIKPYLHIEDSIKATIYHAYNRYGIHNIGPRDNISVLEVAQTIMNELDIHKEIKWTGQSWPGDNQYVEVFSDYPVRSSKQAIIDYARTLK